MFIVVNTRYDCPVDHSEVDLILLFKRGSIAVQNHKEFFKKYFTKRIRPESLCDGGNGLDIYCAVSMSIFILF